jgi:putative hydrolase of the HAD superfamily
MNIPDRVITPDLVTHRTARLRRLRERASDPQPVRCICTRYHGFMHRFPSGQTLLIDADDTLWENNVYFERAIAAFISYLNHHEYTPAEVRQTLNAVERETILAHGYGLPSFTRSLVTCFERLSPHPLDEERRKRVVGFANSIAEQEIELLPQVEETLGDLSTRHKLIMMTKGDHAEQADKVQRSGLAQYFSAIEIVAEKDPATYHAVIARHELKPHTSWMVGNSPKSDINPALAAGLHAVFLFHKDTWVLEHAAISTAPRGQYFFEFDSFAKLLDIF